MENSVANLFSIQRNVIVQRLTVIWAFVESCLGGIMHSLKIPFTGLLVGGLAVIIISLIAKNAKNIVKDLLKSLTIVLLVKATVSPYTPFTAYIAVGFQACVAIVLFKILALNAVSIFMLSIMAMMESAIQKLLVLTLFFGQSIWDAVNVFFSYICNQFGYKTINGTILVISIYIGIYLLGAVAIALLALKILKRFDDRTELFLLPEMKNNLDKALRSKRIKKIVVVYILLAIISMLLLLLNFENNNKLLMVLRMFIWTTTATVLWYFIITPLFVKTLLVVLKKSKKKYSSEILEVISTLPLLKKIALYTWENSKAIKGFNRVSHFVSNLLYWSIVYVEHSNEKE